MAAYFLDSSALVKRYVREAGTPWVISLTDPAAANELFVARLTGIEVVSAMTRRSRGGDLDPSAAATALAEFRHDFAHQYQTLEITAAIVDRAMTLAEKHALRAYDAVQLAAALETDGLRADFPLPPLVFVCADQELNAAAQAEGLPVADPDGHP